MKVLYTSHICGDRTGVVQRIIECDDLLAYIADDAGISTEDLTTTPLPTVEEDDSFVVNEYGVFIATSDCHESWVIISQ